MPSAPPDPPLRVPTDAIGQTLADPAFYAQLTRTAVALLGKHLPFQPQEWRRERAEDVVQETSCRAYQAASRFDPTRGNPRGWVTGILMNVVRETIRRISQNPSALRDDFPPADQIAIEHGLAVDEEVLQRLDLEELLARLPSAQEELIRLRFMEGFELSDLMAHYAISNVAVRVRLSRALNVLRELAGHSPKEGGR